MDNIHFPKWNATDKYIDLNGEYILSKRMNFDAPVYFERRYGIFPSILRDSCSYSENIFSYLEKNGAQIICKDESLNRSKRIPYRLKDILHISGGGSHKIWVSSNDYYYWYKGMILNLCREGGSLNLSVYYPPNSCVNVDEYAPYILSEKQSSVSVLLEDEGFYIKDISFDPPVIDNLELNYGTGFSIIHKQIVDKLVNRSAGLFLFRGAPGVGKSTYIQYITNVVNRKFIFIPVNLSSDLSSPTFVKLLLENKESVLILEDSEHALSSREESPHNSSVVSTLLNLSDGILGKLLQCTLICTFNSPKHNIDRALLRKGRLMFDYEFKKLPIEDAKKLALHLGKKIDIKEPTSLSDIYGAEDNTNYKEIKAAPLGFGAILEERKAAKQDSVHQ